MNICVPTVGNDGSPRIASHPHPYIEQMLTYCVCIVYCVLSLSPVLADPHLNYVPYNLCTPQSASTECGECIEAG